MSTQTLDKSVSPSRALGNAARHARAFAGDALQTVGKALDEGRARAGEQLDAGRQAVVGYVNEKPFTTIGIAALAGIVIGLLLFRRQ